MRIEYDEKADALYISLSERSYAFGRDLDDRRRIDFDADGRPIGVELLFPSLGIDLHDLPLDASVARQLTADYRFAVRV
jgi:uncharacterized protein YuzE